MYFLRHVEINRDNPKPSNIQIKAAEAMISKLKFSYDPDNIDNPVIQKHYKCLEAMALDKDQPEEFEDHTSSFKLANICYKSRVP